MSNVNRNDFQCCKYANIMNKDHSNKVNLDPRSSLVTNGVVIGTNCGKTCGCESKTKNQTTQATNFPNVGSSPLSDEFFNTDSSDNEQDNLNEESPNLDILEEKTVLVEHKPDNNISSTVESDFDGIIIYGRKKKKSNEVLESTKEVTSLSDDDEIIVEEGEHDEDATTNDENDDNDPDNDGNLTPVNTVDVSKSLIKPIVEIEIEPVLPCKRAQQIQSINQQDNLNNSKNSMQQTIINEIKPQSIMKNSSSKFINECKSIVQQQQLNLSNETGFNNQSVINTICGSSYLSNSPSSCNTAMSSHGTPTNAASSQKPKVRFNLDINYEKEREWNRVNKIIGDVSKSQIEWTQEVEV